MEPAPSAIELGNVRLTAEALYELDGVRPVITIPRKEVRRIELCHGRQSERPWLSVAFGGVLVIAGLAPLPVVIRGVIDGRVFWPLALACPFALVGAYLIYDALRAGHYLLVELPRDRRKLSFKRGTPEAEIAGFLGHARDELGYVVEG